MKRPAGYDFVDKSLFEAPSKTMKRKEKEVVRAGWTEPQRAHLVSPLVEYGGREFRTDNGWNAKAWTATTKSWSEKFSDAKYSRNQIKDQEQHLKKNFKSLK